MVALAITGLIVQCRAKKQLDKEREHKKGQNNKNGAYTRINY